MARTHRTADSNVERALRRQHRRDSAAHRTNRQLPTVGNPEPDWRFTGGLQMRMEWRS